MHTAAEFGRLDALKLILDTKKINVDNAIDSGKTALHLASFKGYLKIAKLLVEQYNSNVNI